MKQSRTFAAASLWASAFVLAGLVIVQAGRLPGQKAYADQSSTNDSYTLITANAGLGGEEPYELLYVVDSRAEAMLVYEIEDARNGRIVPRVATSISNLFRAAR